jgi:hypothetical protein
MINPVLTNKEEELVPTKVPKKPKNQGFIPSGNHVSKSLTFALRG